MPAFVTSILSFTLANRRKWHCGAVVVLSALVFLGDGDQFALYCLGSIT